MKSPSLRAYAIAYLIFLYAPIILLPMFALNDSKVVQFPLKGFTFEWFHEMTQDAQLGIAVKNSLVIAFSSATLSTVPVCACSCLTLKKNSLFMSARLNHALPRATRKCSKKPAPTFVTA